MNELIGVVITLRLDVRSAIYGGPISDEGIEVVVEGIEKVTVVCPSCNNSFLDAELTLFTAGEVKKRGVIRQHWFEQFLVHDDDTWMCGSEEDRVKPWMRMWLDTCYHISTDMLLPYIYRKKMVIYQELLTFLYSDCAMLVLDLLC